MFLCDSSDHGGYNYRADCKYLLILAWLTVSADAIITVSDIDTIIARIIQSPFAAKSS